MLLPISHEKMTVRRLPVVTIAIIVVTVLAHAIASFGASGKEERAIASMLTARLLYLQRPSLGVCAPLKPFVTNAPVLDLPVPDALEKPDEGDKRDVAERYEAACKDLAEAFDGLPAQRFGYVPARANFLGLFTYMFVHADWWHVIGNMWFLFLCGLALEDRWGRVAFVAYYVVGGVVAAGLHHLMTGDASAALIGASGAVAAAMGAFLVLFATTKIRFVGFLAFRVFSFAAPAYVMLPMWAGIEVLYGLLASSSGTAHWAHVGGFAFGAAVATGFRIFGVDRKLDDAVERAVVLGDDPRVDAARALVAKGEATQAVALLEGLAKEKPESIHVWEALRDVARANGDTALADHAAAQMAAREAARAGRPSAPVPAVPPSGRPSVPSVRASAPSRTSTPVVRPVRPSAPAEAVPPGGPEPAPFFPPPPAK
jgi:membrane associated rhomboid family serine protease